MTKNPNHFPPHVFPDFSHWKPFDICHIFNIIGFFLYFLTTILSVCVLINKECRHPPLQSTNWIKAFHFLLPISQITYCIPIILSSMYCLNIVEQDLLTMVLSSVASYFTILCVLLNSLHWAFYFFQSDYVKLKKIIVGLVVTFFLVIPSFFEVLICLADSNTLLPIPNSDLLHQVEFSYSAILNVFVILSVFFAWYMLHKHLKDHEGLETIRRKKRHLTLQMFLNIFFFSIRLFCMLIIGISQFTKISEERNTSWDHGRRILFFVYTSLGDVPLVFVMVGYLAFTKFSPSSSSSSSSSSSLKDPLNMRRAVFEGGNEGDSLPIYTQNSVNSQYQSLVE